ncbi:signal peptidase II [Clostridium hydrogeniformans]|uniref:signal peptidase II n=1 Tax=Clostridium hydrogeniformans TaxID=349933 RepID=UPI003BF95021
MGNLELVIIILGIILDRVTKIYALNNLAGKKDLIIIKDFFQFSYLENRGAAFGIFQNRVIFLTLFTCILISAMIFYLYKNRKSSKLLAISLSMVISGAIGNLFDRVYYKYVVDFILLHYKDVYYYPTFNVADILVVVGTVLLGIYIIKDVK